MRDDNGSTIRSVAWTDLCPWLILVRAVRLALSPRVLLLGAVGIGLTLSVWSVLGAVFPLDEQTSQWLRPGRGCPWMAVDEAVPDHPRVPAVPNGLEADELARSPWHAVDPFFGTFGQLSRPLWEAFRPGTTFSKLVCLFLCGLGSLAIWAFFGAAIVRIAAVRLTCDEPITLAAALRHACSKWLSYFAAPLFPLLGIALAAVPVWLLGLVLRGEVGLLLAALIWPAFLLAALVMTFLLLGLLFGWPLMFGTISTEGTDSFDALSRSYAYTFQRPLNYLFYALVAAVLGWLGWLLVQTFASIVVGLAYSTAGRIDLVLGGGDALGGIGRFGEGLCRFWSGCVKVLAVGYIYSYFWTATAAIYLLLRRDVDATEMDEVFLDDDASESDYGLPPLTTDAQGAPKVVDEPAAEALETGEQEPPAPEDHPPPDSPDPA